jgi:hypothetical protein
MKYLLIPVQINSACTLATFKYYVLDISVRLDYPFFNLHFQQRLQEFKSNFINQYSLRAYASTLCSWYLTKCFRCTSAGYSNGHNCIAADSYMASLLFTPFLCMLWRTIIFNASYLVRLQRCSLCTEGDGYSLQLKNLKYSGSQFLQSIISQT